jgi:CheY-like chemotaxis protein
MNQEHNMTKDQFTILIADRNPRVREFFRRDFTSMGYQVLLARDESDVLKLSNVDGLYDLLILDLDIPYPGGLTALEELQRLKPSLPIVVHTHLMEYEKDPAVQRAAGFLEKKGDNINGLKQMVAQILREFYPNRVPIQSSGEKPSTDEFLAAKERTIQVS